MYDIRQFRPTLYLLIALGFTGFALSVGAPIMWLFGMSLLLFNAWLLKNGRFRPLPRWLANALTLIAALYTASQVYNDPRPIFPIGNFLLVLQLIKAYEQRGNRDYAQLLVLSLLLMVAAAISTAGLLFGILFIFYLLLSPYACLLFHLKVETDHAKRQMGLDERLANPLTLRQDQRYLNRSMTHLTGLVASFATVMAVLVFLFFPRGAGSNVLSWQFRPAMAATGISDRMSMQSVARVQQNTTEIAYVKVARNGVPVTGGEIYLRGTTYDRYDSDPRSNARWNWASTRAAPQYSLIRPGTEETFVSATPVPERDDLWTQEFMPLKPINVPFLLAMPGAAKISVQSNIRLGYAARDHLITLDAKLMRPLAYTVTSTNDMPEAQSPRAPESNRSGWTNQNANDRNAAAPVALSARIGEFARRPDVSGVDAEGKPLAEALVAGTPPTADLADRIATNVERHLQQNFLYTLDLSDNRPKDDDEDPIVDFLYDSKKGWCEHFAGAMTTICQSLGLQARLVSGYKVDEFNTLGGYFIVRQSHAHAWVEVLVRDGERMVWKTFDPTSARDANAAARAVSGWTRIKHFFNFLEHTWANSVVAYDANTQNSLLDNVESKMVNATLSANSAVKDSRGWFGQISDWFGSINRYTISEGIILIVISLMSMTGICLITWYAWQRYKLMRRAKRIGLDGLQGAEARRLARQLGFYEELLRILAKRHIVRAPHLTPLEFGHSLSFLSNEAYDTIVRLTRIFYRVRYGQTELSAGQRRALSRVIERLQTQLLPYGTD